MVQNNSSPSLTSSIITPIPQRRFDEINIRRLQSSVISFEIFNLTKLMILYISTLKASIEKPIGHFIFSIKRSNILLVF